MSFLNWQQRMVPRMDPVTAIMAGSAGVNLLGGLFGKKSANTQANNLERVARESGQQIIDTTGAVNQQLAAMVDPVNAGINNATAAGIGRVDQATSDANSLLSPYRQSGEEANETLRKLLMEGGDLNRVFGAADFQADPGYAFRLAEGNKILAARQAQSGGLNSGAAVKAAINYNQNAGSAEFQKAFDRFRQQNTDRFDRLFGVAGKGQTAATTSGNNLLEGGKFGANLTVDAANKTGDNLLDIGKTTSGRTIDAEMARQGLVTDAASAAAGARMGGSDRLWGGITGAADSVASGITLKQLLKNPSSRVNYLSPAATSRINSRLPAGVLA